MTVVNGSRCPAPRSGSFRAARSAPQNTRPAAPQFGSRYRPVLRMVVAGGVPYVRNQVFHGRWWGVLQALRATDAPGRVYGSLCILVSLTTGVRCPTWISPLLPPRGIDHPCTTHENAHGAGTGVNAGMPGIHVPWIVCNRVQSNGWECYLACGRCGSTQSSSLEDMLSNFSSP